MAHGGSIPKVGKRYHFFEDGKSGPSRHFIVEITKIIPFEEITDEELLDTYNWDVKECHWLYHPETDFFVYGRKVLADNTLDEENFIFVRTYWDGWFSFGHLFEDGELDECGEKYDAIVKNWNLSSGTSRSYDEVSGTKGLI